MIWITGDTHGEFQRIRYPKGFSWLRNNEGKPTENDYLIICGDFGGIWYDDEREIEQISRLLDNQPFKILCVTGNHENYDAYKKMPITEWNGGKIQKITDNVYRLMNGQVFNIDGYKVFTITENCYVMPIDENDIDFIKRIITPLGLMIYPLIEAETAMKISSHDMVAVECIAKGLMPTQFFLLLTNNLFSVSMYAILERKNAMFIFVNELNNRVYSMRRDMYGFTLLCSFTK